MGGDCESSGNCFKKRRPSESSNSECKQNGCFDVHFQDETRSDAHLQRLARLEFEKLQRQQLAEEHNRKEGDKDELETRLKQKKEQLAMLRPQLQNSLAVRSVHFPLTSVIDWPQQHQ